MAKNMDALMTALRYKKQEKATQPNQRTFNFKAGELGDVAIGQEVSVLLKGVVGSIDPNGNPTLIFKSIGEEEEEPMKLAVTPRP